jgi:hypothetical protein
MPELTAGYLRECFDYDAKTGSLIWKVRPREHFKTKQGWNATNTRCAGLPAGVVRDDGYVMAKISGKIVGVHRIVWVLHTGEWPSELIDHKDGNPGNNRIENLRPANDTYNNANAKLNKRSLIGLKGVSRNGKKWHARLQKDGKRLCLGTYDCPAASHFAYLVAADKEFGDYARAR